MKFFGKLDGYTASVVTLTSIKNVNTRSQVVAEKLSDCNRNYDIRYRSFYRKKLESNSDLCRIIAVN